MSDSPEKYQHTLREWAKNRAAVIPKIEDLSAIMIIITDYPNWANPYKKFLEIELAPAYAAEKTL